MQTPLSDHEIILLTVDALAPLTPEDQQRILQVITIGGGMPAWRWWLAIEEIAQKLGLAPYTTDALDLSVRAYNALKGADIQTVKDLIQWTEDDLLRLRNVGRKTVRNIKVALAEVGLCLQGSSLPTEGERMAERPGFRPRPAAPMVSPAIDAGEDPGRREGIRRELYDRLSNNGRDLARPKRFAGDPSQPDLMPVRQAVGIDDQPLPGGPPGGLDGGLEGMAPPGSIEAQIIEYLGDRLNEFTPEQLEEITSALQQYKGLTGTVPTAVVKGVCDAVGRGSTAQTALSRFAQGSGGY